MTAERTEFAERIGLLLEKRDLTQKELAARSGVKKRALDMYLGRQRSMPPADVAVRLARALGTTVEWLVLGEAERRR